MNASPNTSGLPRALSWAIKYGSKSDILKVFQKDKVDLMVTSKNGDTLAHLIFQNKNCVGKDVIELLKTLFNQGIDPNIENSRKETLLRLAVANRMRDVIDFLVTRKVEINKTDENGLSIAHFSIKEENKKFSEFFKDGRLKISASKLEEMENESANFVEWLIGKGFDFHRRSYFGKSAFDLSIKYNLQHILIVLLKHTKNVNCVTESNENLLHLFFRSSDYRRKNGFASQYTASIVKFILDKGVSAVAVADNGDSPLRIAFEYGQEINIIEVMINHLLETCAQKNLSTNVFVEFFASCAFWDESKVDYYLTILGSLIAEGVNVNSRSKNGMTPLRWAFLAKNVRAVKFLEDHGADFSAIDEDQNLFRELALRPYYDKSTNEEKEALFELLVSKGCCDMHAGDKNQNTPLHLACRMRTKENLVTARKLIEHGADVNCTNEDGQTPLHYAVMHEGIEMTELLLERGANVNSKDKRGDRPIDYAFQSETGLMLLVLLKWGAPVNVSTKILRETTLFVAIRRDWTSIIKPMLTYGADINSRSIYYRFIEYPKWRRRSTIQLILQHWIKLDAAKLPCLKDYRAAYKENGEKIYQICYAEIKLLKNTFIDSDGHTSIYAFLHMDFGSRRVHINNKELKNLVDSPNLEKLFPEYFVLILASYRETVTWKSLLQPAKQAFMELTGVALPDVCSELIFAYLRNEDLLSIIDSVEDEFPR